MAEELDDNPDDALADVFDALDDGDQERATELAVAAQARGLDHPIVLLLVAERQEKVGNRQLALSLLKQATALAPDEPELWRRLAGTYARHGSIGDALEAYRSALALDPKSLSALVGAAAASAKLGDLRDALDLYRNASALLPDDADVLSKAAGIAAYLQAFVEARQFAERALERDPRSLGAQIALGRADIAEGSAAAAADRATALLNEPNLREEQQVAILDLRADAFDALDHVDEAFTDYQKRNALLQGQAAPSAAVIERRADQALRLAKYFSTTGREVWRVAPGDDAEGKRTVRSHVFLLGFPRSGTTLLEKVLAGHSAAVTLEEVDHLVAASGRYLRDDIGLARLGNLTTVQADEARAVYWSGVRKTFGTDISDKVLVDKLPLHTLALPVISKLFPEAKILFALRDPRDVVLSCFRRRFEINSAMFEFLTLEGAAQYYDRVMSLARIYRDVLPLQLREARHEAIVAGFESEVRAILAFIGLDWEAGVKGFADRAKSTLRTPSDPQVARGLNAEGIAQWRRYARQLSPVLDILRPWVDRFGYAP